MSLHHSFPEKHNIETYHLDEPPLCLVASYLYLHYHFLYLHKLVDYLLSHLVDASTIIIISRGYHYFSLLFYWLKYTWVGTISPHMPRLSTVITCAIKRWPAACWRCDSLAILNQIMRWSAWVITCVSGHAELNWLGASVDLLEPLK